MRILREKRRETEGASSILPETSKAVLDQQLKHMARSRKTVNEKFREVHQALLRERIKLHRNRLTDHEIAEILLQQGIRVT